MDLIILCKIIVIWIMVRYVFKYCIIFFNFYNNFDRGNVFKNLILILGLFFFVWIIYFNNLFLFYFFDFKDILFILVYY